MLRQQINSDWFPAMFKGLIIGTSTREEMVRVFGEPKWSELFAEDKGPAEQWFHYDAGGEFAGELVFNVDKKSGVILRLILSPTKLSRNDAIKHFGENYKLTRYEFCKGFEEEESAPIYETPTGRFLYVEYRTKGIALHIQKNDDVGFIAYEREPIGSKCKNSSISLRRKERPR